MIYEDVFTTILTCFFPNKLQVQKDLKVTYFLFSNFNLPAQHSIIEVPGDGHCLFYTWEIAMAASETTKFYPAYASLLDIVRMEFVKNQEQYRPFFYGEPADYVIEIEKTLNDKSYANPLSEMMVNALANTTRTTAVIWEKDGCEMVQRNIITPANGAASVNGIIHLHKEGQHYEPIVQKHQKGTCMRHFSFHKV